MTAETKRKFNRIYIFGTGRCGTKTFAKACTGAITNFTSGHESNARALDVEQYIQIPENHIEVDPHFVWMLGSLAAIAKYPALRDSNQESIYRGMFFVWLHREPQDVIASWRHRTMKSTGAVVSLCRGIFQNGLNPLTEDRADTACQALHELITNQCMMFRDYLFMNNGMHLNNFLQCKIEDSDKWAEEFWWRVGADGDVEKFKSLLKQRVR